MPSITGKNVKGQDWAVQGSHILQADDTSRHSWKKNASWAFSSSVVWKSELLYSQGRWLLFNHTLYMVKLYERCNRSQCIQNKEMWSGFNTDHQTDVILTPHNSAKNFLSSISRIRVFFVKTHTLTHVHTQDSLMWKNELLWKIFMGTCQRSMLGLLIWIWITYREEKTKGLCDFAFPLAKRSPSFHSVFHASLVFSREMGHYKMVPAFLPLD